MSITNGSFEDQATGAQSGLADGWTSSETYTAEEYAEFVNAIILAGTLTSGQETFEGEWPTGYSDGLHAAFVAYFDDLDLAFFDSEPQGYEDMENIWGTAPQGVVNYEDLTPQFALFAEGGTGEQADAEVELWGYDGNGDTLEVLSFGGSDLDFAGFDTSPQDYENFENEWDDNENYNWTFPISGAGAELDFASFYISYATASDFEPYEGVRTDLVGFSVDPSSDLINYTSHNLQDEYRITLYNENGRLPDGLLSETKFVVVNTTTNSFQVSPRGGVSPPIVDIVDHGFGTHYIKHDTMYYWTEELEGF
jgi:hypothetical protein